MTPLRHVHLTLLRDGRTFELRTWDTGRTDSRGQSYIAYRFGVVGESEPIFEGSDFAGSPMTADDSDQCLATLLGFLTLRRGDTDAGYFDDYTPEQLDWTEDFACEVIGADVSCFEEDARDNPDVTPPWVDVDVEGDAAC
jgi:hypothetical protein